MNNSLKYFAFSMLLAAMTGCAEDITQTVGSLPDETPMNTVGGILRSERTLMNLIDIDLYEEDEEESTENISYTLTKPATSAVTLKAIADEALAEAYNEHNNLESKVFPAANVHFENEGTLTIAAGKQTSAPVKMSISTEGLETGTLYLLALTIEKAAANVEAQAEKQALYYRIYIEKKATHIEPTLGMPEPIPELLPNLTCVFYVNTETYQPFVVNGQAITTQPKGGKRQMYSLGNIVNLKRATINYDAASQRVLFALGADLSYVLEHSNKYLRPIQVHDRKICICIENGGKGVGFCNMTATQITDFVRQVKAVVERYDIDGINLWDDDSKYGKAGMPEMNTTSYPTLIKKLREALPDKLLTVVDKGDATEYFYDVDKCGGIKVGDYIDYAWHGYCSPKETLQIINPNPEGSTQTYSKYTRKPIAGLDEQYYGNVNVPCYNDNDSENRDPATEIMLKWKIEGKKNNILVYGNDLIGQEYGGYEGATQSMISSYGVPNFMDDGYTWNFETNTRKAGTTRYTAGRPFDAGATGPDNNPFRKDW